MKVNDRTIRGLKIARQRRELTSLGYERVGADFSGNLWELHRGSRKGHEIVDVVIGVDGMSVWVKIVPRQANTIAA